MQVGFEKRAPPVLVLKTAAGVLELAHQLALQVHNVLDVHLEIYENIWLNPLARVEISDIPKQLIISLLLKYNFNYLQVLNFLDELDVLLGQPLLVRGDVHDGAVKLLNLDVQFADGDLQPLASLGDGDLLLADILHLGQQLVNLSLELRLFLLRPADKEFIVLSRCLQPDFVCFVPIWCPCCVREDKTRSASHDLRNSLSKFIALINNLLIK